MASGRIIAQYTLVGQVDVWDMPAQETMESGLEAARLGLSEVLVECCKASNEDKNFNCSSLDKIYSSFDVNGIFAGAESHG